MQMEVIELQEFHKQPHKQEGFEEWDFLEQEIHQGNWGIERLGLVQADSLM